MFKNLGPSLLGITGHQSEIIELALTFGFRGMDINITDFAIRAKIHGMRYARRLIDSAKIRIGTFELPVNCEADNDLFAKDLKELAEYADAAVEIGCLRCVATVAPAGDKRPYHENFEFHRRRFTEICHVLEPRGIRLGIGFQAAEYLRKSQAFQFIHDFDALMLLTKMVDASNVGLLLDVWDLVAGGGLLESIKKLSLDQIVSVQLADMPSGVAPPQLDENSRLLPGASNGQIDCVAVLRNLAEMGYDGPIAVKPSRRLFPNRRRDMIVKLTGETLARVWRAAGLNLDGRIVGPIAPMEPIAPPEPPRAEPIEVAEQAEPEEEPAAAEAAEG
jgi:sugar phosphate isomerase/epimerase